MKKSKIPLLYCLSFVLSVLPVSIYFFVNSDRYIKTIPDRIKITAGLVILSVIVILKVIGKLKMPSRTVLFGFVFIMCFLLGRVLNDLIVFSFLALVGEILDSICQIYIRRERERILTEKAANATADKLKKILNGRV